MSVFKQILLSIVVLAIAAGGWYAWDRNMIPFLPRPTVAAGGAGWGGGAGGLSRRHARLLGGAVRAAFQLARADLWAVPAFSAGLPAHLWRVARRRGRRLRSWRRR